MFFFITLIIAALIAGVTHMLKGQSFDGTFIRRLLVTWVIVMAASVVLFLGWCFIALSQMHGPIN